METVVGAALIQERLFLVRAEVEVMAQLVVNGAKIVVGLLGAHLDAQVVQVVDVPRARVAYHLPVARPREHRALPERRGERIEAE